MLKVFKEHRELKVLKVFKAQPVFKEHREQKEFKVQ